MTNQLPPSLQRFGAAFEAAAREELTPTLAHAEAPKSGRGHRLRPRALAGSTLGLACVGAALVFALGTSATPPAFAVTQHSDGSVSVKLNPGSGLSDGIVGANRKLAEMNLHEGISIQMATGAAPASGPVTCTSDATGASRPGTPVSAYVGTDNTVVLPPGDNGAGNTGVGNLGGTYHLASCTIHNSNLTPSQIGTTSRSGKDLIINAG